MVLCALAALIAVGVQMDRQARREPRIAHMVPSIFRAYALEALARSAYSDGDSALGLAYSRQLVSRRPVPEEGLSLLTLGLIKAGDNERALAALLLSAERGWRAPYTQTLMVLAAEQAGDYDVATQRLLSLWRQGNQGADVKQMTATVLSSRDGVSHFAQGIIPRDSSWATNFLLWAAVPLSDDTIRIVVGAMSRKRLHMDCRKLSPVTRGLVHAQKVSAATTLWSTLCSALPIKQADDFNFNLVPGPVGPFDWRLSEQAGIDARIHHVGSESYLSYTNFSQVRMQVAERTAVLSSGAHKAWMVNIPGQRSDADDTLLRITCRSPSIPAGKTFVFEINPQGAFFSIPESGCTSQELGLWVRRGEAVIGPLRIDSISKMKHQPIK